jgi:DNA-3-methyladenine glycosylase
MPSWKPLPVSFYRRPAETVARELLGRWLVREADGERLVLRLVETEAYLGAPDAASHAAGGRRTERNESLYLPGGYAYVYFIYGIHFCLNAVTGRPDAGSAVLLRAGEPVAGETAMRRRRGLLDRPRPVRPGDVAGGPGKLCQALAIDRAQDSVPLYRGELKILEGDPLPAEQVARGPRVGVDYAGEAAAWPLRFAERGNPHVSRPRL